MQSLFLLHGGDYLKKILCFALALLLCLSSVCTAYASSTDSDHGGTGGSLGDDHGGTGGSLDWDKLEAVDPAIADKAVMKLFAPDLAGAIELVESYFKPDQMDDDTRNYIKDNAGDNVKTDGNYYYINQNFIQNVNQKVQNRVHALDGYYLIDSLGAINRSNLIYYTKQFYNIDLVAKYPSSKLSQIDDMEKYNTIFLTQYRHFYVSSGDSIGNDEYLYIDNYVYCCDSNEKSHGFKYFSEPLSSSNQTSTAAIELTFFNDSNILGVLGSPVKIFYSKGDLRKYLYYGTQHYSPNLPNKTIKIPINYTTISPSLNLDFDISGKLDAEIQGQLDLAFQGWLDKLLELSVPSNPTPTPGSSSGGSGGGSSGGDHGGTGGDFGTVTPTPNPDDGFTSGTYNLLEEIYKWLVSFGEKHDIFAKKITDYIEANDGKLDQIIEAINTLGEGKTETDANGCKYDFTALSDFMTDLWNDSDQKFDNMIVLLEENNKYQQKLVNSLNEIKAILVTQTVLELFQDRSSETANKAKDKFPTSLPWDIAMVVNAMAAEPQEIKINLPIEIQSLGIHEEINIDLSNEEWEKLAKTCRYLLSILFILFMIHLSRKMFFSGGDD